MGREVVQPSGWDHNSVLSLQGPGPAAPPPTYSVASSHRVVSVSVCAPDENKGLSCVCVSKLDDPPPLYVFGCLCLSEHC